MIGPSWSRQACLVLSHTRTKVPVGKRLLPPWSPSGANQGIAANQCPDQPPHCDPDEHPGMDPWPTGRQWAFPSPAAPESGPPSQSCTQRKRKARKDPGGDTPEPSRRTAGPQLNFPDTPPPMWPENRKYWPAPPPQWAGPRKRPLPPCCILLWGGRQQAPATSVPGVDLPSQGHPLNSTGPGTQSDRRLVC